jgi:hypothetical protein
MPTFANSQAMMDEAMTWSRKDLVNKWRSIRRPFIIESKDGNDAVTIGTVAKLRFRLEKRPPGTMAVLFSVGRISTPTEVFAQFASPLNVLLWSAADMEVALHSSGMTDGLRRKFAHAVQYGLPLLPLASKK